MTELLDNGDVNSPSDLMEDVVARTPGLLKGLAIPDAMFASLPEAELTLWDRTMT